jgi:hypothetical protein
MYPTERNGMETRAYSLATLVPGTHPSLTTIAILQCQVVDEEADLVVWVTWVVRMAVAWAI